MNTVYHMVFIGVAANLDNLAVGMAYGMRRIRVPVLSNFAMAAIAFLFTYFSAWVGTYAGRLVSESTATIAGAVLLILFGLWIMAAQYFQPQKEHRAEPAGPAPERTPSMLTLLQEPDQADLDHSGSISLPEALILGVAISINCFANGFSAGLWRLAPLPTAFCTGALSYLSLWGGGLLGSRFAARWLGDKAALAAGCLLVLLGLQQLL